MNKTKYDLAQIEGRVASLEEDCWQAIETAAVVPMTATIVPEIRFLVDTLKNKKHTPGNPRPIEPALEKIDAMVAGMEKKLGRAIRAGKFSRISASIVPDMRYLLDQLGVEHSEDRDEEDAFAASAVIG